MSWLAPLLALGVLGCSTEHIRSTHALVQEAPGPEGGLGKGQLFVHSALPASRSAPLRLRVNGRDVVYDDGGDRRYAELYSVGVGVGTGLLPEGAYVVELVDRRGHVKLRTPPVAVHGSEDGITWPMTSVLAHPHAEGADALIADTPEPAVDPSTTEITLRNATTDDVVVAYRCLAVDGVSDDCTELARLAPGETWSTQQPHTQVGFPFVGAAFFALGFATDSIAPQHAVDLNEPRTICGRAHPAIVVYGAQTVTAENAPVQRVPLTLDSCFP